MASERTWHNFEMIIFALNIFCVPVVIFSESKNKRKTLHKYYNVCKLYRVTAADASERKRERASESNGNCVSRF